MREVGIVPERRSRAVVLLQVSGIFLVRDLGRGKLESIDPDAMHWPLIVLTRVGAHEEPTRRNREEPGFERDNQRGWIRIHLERRILNSAAQGRDHGRDVVLLKQANAGDSGCARSNAGADVL